jgi:hypothetical protein
MQTLHIILHLFLNLGCFILFIVGRAFCDYLLIEEHEIDLKGKYKVATSWLTVSICIVVTNSVKPYNLLLFISLLLSYGFLFDTLLNYLRGKPKEHLGSGPIDTFWSMIPYQFQVRISLLIILICLNIQSLLWQFLHWLQSCISQV